MKEIKYVSTRGEGGKVTSAQAIKQGLCSDGGLFMPDSLPLLTPEYLEKLRGMSYAERAANVMSLYLTDYTYEELLEDCEKAYSAEKFKGGCAPIKATENLRILELWHGPTCAFKDMALQIMPRLLSRALDKTGEDKTALILVATSGDTGKAALEGYRDVDKIKIQVFYPVDGVSRIQKKQMQTQGGNNVCVTAIKGNFDDAQSGVKKIFSDKETASVLEKNGYFFSSANSINWGRLVPQVVYYVSAYCDLLDSGEISLGDKVNVCVPTGNFGNIFAAYLAKRSGLPIDKLICASNVNNVLTDFLNTGVYDRNRTFRTTMSPSMDILISSNLERLLYLAAGAEKTSSYMAALAKDGKYGVDPDVFEKIKESFIGGFCTEEETSKTIREIFEKYGYLIDTHTAVGVKCAREYAAKTGDTRPIITASTASPYKFAPDVLSSLTPDVPEDEFEAIDALSALSKTEAPAPLASLREKTVRFDRTVEKEEMTREVLRFAGIE